ncbi:MAG: putative response regulator in two-component reguatory system, sigma54 dependent transcriptional, partial [candidate division NC10 bacterium]|nr:putative response regulator in two-component reguatory system, sigma54 dependent transcriptional [candidate division NC10 bacterium]
ALEAPAGFHEAVVVYKRQLIRETLQLFGGNQSRAAGALGLQRTYLSRLIKELQVRDRN